MTATWRDVADQQDEAERIFAELRKLSQRLFVAVDDYLDTLDAEKAESLKMHESDG